MNRNSILPLLLIFSLLGPLRAASAQDPFDDPFGAADLDAPVLDADSESPAAETEAEDEGEETDPVVLALRDQDPQTPIGRMRAVEILVNLGRPDEAEKYIQQLLDAELDRSELATLQAEFGTAFFLRLLRHDQLQPIGAELADAVAEAAHAEARDPSRLEMQIAKLNDSSPKVRSAAIADLRRAGQVAVQKLIGVLADDSRGDEHGAVRRALVHFGKEAVAPLTGALQADDPSLRAQVIETLGRLEASEAVVLLLRPYFQPDDERISAAARFALLKIVGALPTQRQAESYLERRTKALLDGKPARDLDQQDRVTIWRWDPAKRTAVPRQFEPRLASLQTAARLADHLYALGPDNLDYRRIYLTALLESARRTGGFEQALADSDTAAYAQATAAGAEVIEDVLAYAMDRGHVAAAIAAAEVLGDLGDLDVVSSGGERARPLVQAVRHPDRRLQFTAVMSILALDPQEPFAGSSSVAEALGYFSQTSGSRRVLIAHPRAERARTLVGMLNELGYDGDAAHTGASARRLARRNPDYELVLLSTAIDRPRAGELLQQLRQDRSTARLPVGLMAHVEASARIEQVAEEDPLTRVFPPPHDPAALALQTRRLLEHRQHETVDFEERVQQAQAALEQLARLAEQPAVYGFYDLFRQQAALEGALYNPQLSRSAAPALGRLGSPSAQRALVNAASQNTRALPVRQAAAQAFAQAVQRRGLLLSRNEILQQYDRYNQSAHLEPETQEVLGSILDAIEAPTQGASAKPENSTEGTPQVEQQ